jgi:hypothetical protein
MQASITRLFIILSLTFSRTLKIRFQGLLSMSYFGGGIGMFYNLLCPKHKGLMRAFHHSKVFPATSRAAGAAVSRVAMMSSQKRIQESRERQARAEVVSEGDSGVAHERQAREDVVSEEESGVA